MILSEMHLWHPESNWQDITNLAQLANFDFLFYTALHASSCAKNQKGNFSRE